MTSHFAEPPPPPGTSTSWNYQLALLTESFVSTAPTLNVSVSGWARVKHRHQGGGKGLEMGQHPPLPPLPREAIFLLPFSAPSSSFFTFCTSFRSFYIPLSRKGKCLRTLPSPWHTMYTTRWWQ